MQHGGIIRTKAVFGAAFGQVHSSCSAVWYRTHNRGSTHLNPTMRTCVGYEAMQLLAAGLKLCSALAHRGQAAEVQILQAGSVTGLTSL